MGKIDLRKLKLLPLNMTARASAIVRGNPVSTRPESGVDNSFPGLEFDQRNIDKAFFPGFIFEFHSGIGVPLREVRDEQLRQFVSLDDISKGVFLLAVRGRFPTRRAIPGQAVDSVQPLARIADLDAWRIIHDLEPGPISIALGTIDSRTQLDRLLRDDSEVLSALETHMSDGVNGRKDIPDLGTVLVLFGTRAGVLTKDGVIDPTMVEPGELTRSLCAPWQYDFTDCGCFYWASNKPDLVSSDANMDQILNFQRRDRSPETDKGTTRADWLSKNWDQATNRLNHAEMIHAWANLPFVIGGRETSVAVPPIGRKLKKPLDRKTIVARLKALAPVEHALAVEYLYAYYSLGINAGPGVSEPSNTASEKERRCFTAAKEVYQVAVDEMRHLRWVNEALSAIDEKVPILSRAKVIGEDVDGDGRALNRPYELLPLTPQQLDWFIKVELPSQQIDPDGDEDTIDGMYTHILLSVQSSREFNEQQKELLSHYVKTIIDEGADHVERFQRAKDALASLRPEEYLVVTKKPSKLPAGTNLRKLQVVVDTSYVTVLETLDYTFTRGDLQHGEMLHAAIRAMINMDDAARLLARKGHGALFSTPEGRRVAKGSHKAKPITRSLRDMRSVDRVKVLTTQARGIGSRLRSALGDLDTSGDSELQALSKRMRARHESMCEMLVRNVGGS